MADVYDAKVTRVVEILDAGDPDLSNRNLARSIVAAVDAITDDAEAEKERKRFRGGWQGPAGGAFC